MIDLSHDIKSLSDFRRNTSRFVEQLKRTRRPVVLTLNGRAEVVIQDAASYQELLNAARELELLQAGEQLAASKRKSGTSTKTPSKKSK